MNAPQGFRRWLACFGCPSCGYRSFFSYSAGRLGADRRRIKLLFWCVSCGRFSTLKHPWRVPIATLIFSLVSFFVIYWLLMRGLTDAEFSWVPLWIACATVVLVDALLLLGGRFTKDYVAIDHVEP